MVCSKEREHVPLLGGQVDLIDDTVVVKRLRYDTVVAVNTGKLPICRKNTKSLEYCKNCESVHE